MSEPQAVPGVVEIHHQVPRLPGDPRAGRIGCHPGHVQLSGLVFDEDEDVPGTDREPGEVIEELCGRVRCPVLVVHGTDDQVRPHGVGERLAELTGGSLVLIEGGGHGPPARDPVKVNRLIREFVETIDPAVRRTTWIRAQRRPQRALYLSSPIGLGHAKRDVAIAERLRRHHPDLQVDWLAQHPVTKVLKSVGERIHPASAWLASESTHIEDEAAEHDLHVAVGGSGVGEPLLRRVLDAAPIARRLLPELHFLVVAGPRIDPGSLPRRRGVRIRGYLPDLYRHLAACDLAVVQCGLTTCMELTANRRPFIYVPPYGITSNRTITCGNASIATPPGGA